LGKAVVKIDPHPSDVLPIGSLFDESGIGQRFCPELVWLKLNNSSIFHSYIYDCRPTLHVIPKRSVVHLVE